MKNYEEIIAALHEVGIPYINPKRLVIRVEFST